MLMCKDFTIADEKYRGLCSGAMATFGENLRRLRKRAGLTQNDLAARMEFSNNSPISGWERAAEGRLPDAPVIQQFAKSIGCEPRELLENVVTEYDKLRGVGQTPSPKKDIDARAVFNIEQEPSAKDLGGSTHALPRDRRPQSSPIIDAKVQRLTALRDRHQLADDLEAAAAHIRRVAHALRPPQQTPAALPPQQRFASRDRGLRRTGTDRGKKR